MTMWSAVNVASVDLDLPGTGDAASATKQVDPGSFEPRLLPGIGIRGHHEVAPRQRCLHVDVRRALSVAGGLHRFAGPKQRLGRDAGPVGALAADQLAFHDRDPHTPLGDLRGRVLSGGTATQHDDVVVGGHVVTLLCCGRTGRSWPSGRPS